MMHMMDMMEIEGEGFNRVVADVIELFVKWLKLADIPIEKVDLWNSLPLLFCSKIGEEDDLRKLVNRIKSYLKRYGARAVQRYDDQFRDQIDEYKPFYLFLDETFNEVIVKIKNIFEKTFSFWKKEVDLGTFELPVPKDHPTMIKFLRIIDLFRSKFESNGKNSGWILNYYVKKYGSSMQTLDRLVSDLESNSTPEIPPQIIPTYSAAELAEDRVTYPSEFKKRWRLGQVGRETRVKQERAETKEQEIRNKAQTAANVLSLEEVKRQEDELENRYPEYRRLKERKAELWEINRNRLKLIEIQKQYKRNFPLPPSVDQELNEIEQQIRNFRPDPITRSQSKNTFFPQQQQENPPPKNQMRVKVRIISGEPAAAAAAAAAEPEPEPVPAPISVPSIPKKRSIMRLDKATGQLVAQVPTPPIVAPTRRRSPDIAEVIAGDRSAMMLDLPPATPAQIERFEHRFDPKPKAARRPNQWIEHVARVRAELPAGTSYSTVLKTASKSYVGAHVPLTKKHAVKSIRTGPWDPDEVPIPPDAIVVQDGDVYVPSKREGKRGTLIRINKKNNLMERMAGIDGGALGVLDEPGILIDLEGGALIERNWNDQARRILDGFGAWTIVSIRVQRAPVQAFVTGLLNTVTLGGYKAAMKSAGYDKMFHLGHVLTLRREPDGAMKRVILEKNEVVNLSDKIPTEKDMEFHDIGIPSPFKTLNEYVATTLKAIGSGAFFLYDAQRRNCQRFIMDNLRANGILTDSAAAFIQQEADSIFKRLPGLQQFARTLTDLGAAVSHVKDETIAVAKDVAKGAKIAAKSTVKQINKAAKKVGRLFGRGLVQDGLKIQSVLIDRSVPLDDVRRICERNGWTMEFGIDSKPGYHRVRQMDPALFKKGSFRTMDPDGSGPLKFIIGKLK